MLLGTFDGLELCRRDNTSVPKLLKLRDKVVIDGFPQAIEHQNGLAELSW